MPKSTPGPWRVRSCQTAVLIDVARNGEAMLIALVADNDTEGDTETDRKLNNARLIAAAPEMLEVLREFMGDFVSIVTAANHNDLATIIYVSKACQKEISELLKKVEGEE